jgi:hypothetical protein
VSKDCHESYLWLEYEKYKAYRYMDPLDFLRGKLGGEPNYTPVGEIVITEADKVRLHAMGVLWE